MKFHAEHFEQILIQGVQIMVQLKNDVHRQIINRKFGSKRRDGFEQILDLIVNEDQIVIGHRLKQRIQP
ncbi:hypothetical protein D1872_230750 [compost metagenome]